MQIVQPQPDESGDYVPATPLNISCEDPNAMNEVYNNKVIALTTYKKTFHGPYGASGQWASSMFFVEMTHGKADFGNYSIYLHDNEFVSNDLFVSTNYGKVNMTVKVKGNKFTIGENPTNNHRVFENIGRELESSIKDGTNEFIGMKP
ncbi:MAG: hypothetical protein A2231_07365 [Candidatus Firestonebacteria bacterium RIFOXYA2_FULL_40_8]|nr:MAG: hypothetical protein A2231_07365 [Candidatus Firestonebacteria bacterium RIFOXYA2_FULL_40_8]